MLYTDIRTSTSHDGIRNTQLVFGYSRKPTPSTSTRKAIIGAIIAILAFISFIALQATDVPDTKPTITLEMPR